MTESKHKTFELPLSPAPDANWQKQWDRLMQDDWLRKKLERVARVREHFDYLNQYAPEFWDMEPGTVIDIGPGLGELLEIARACGCGHLGMDTLSGSGGMGQKYVDAAILMSERQNINTLYTDLGAYGLLDYQFKEGNLTYRCLRAADVAFVNSRGSWEQIFHDHMTGPPHHKHQDCKRLSWQLDKSLQRQWEIAFDFIASILRPGGVFLLHCNGAQNTEAADKLLNKIAERHLQLVDYQPRLHKWIKC